MEFNWQTLVLSLVPLILGISFVWAKVDKLLKALKELGDVLHVIAEAFADKDLTKEEQAKIKLEVSEAIAAFKAILK